MNGVTSSNALIRKAQLRAEESSLLSASAIPAGIKLLGIVCARGGSKSIPHKNLYPVAGMPLIYYCIENAKGSGIFNRIICSTDDQKIGKAAESFGVQFQERPSNLAKDDTPHFEVVKNVLGSLMESYDYAAIISPTAPLIQGFHWEEAWEKLLTEGASSITSVIEIPEKYHPEKAFVQYGMSYNVGYCRIDGTPRQELPKSYYSTAGIYIFRTTNLELGDFYGVRPTIYEIDSDEYAIDINELEDIDEARCRISMPCYPSIKEKDEILYKELCESYE